LADIKPNINYIRKVLLVSWLFISFIIKNYMWAIWPHSDDGLWEELIVSGNLQLKLGTSA